MDAPLCKPNTQKVLLPKISASDIGQNIIIACDRDWFSTVTQIGSLLIHFPSRAAVLPSSADIKIFIKDCIIQRSWKLVHDYDG